MTRRLSKRRSRVVGLIKTYLFVAKSALNRTCQYANQYREREEKEEKARLQSASRISNPTIAREGK